MVNFGSEPKPPVFPRDGAWQAVVVLWWWLWSWDGNGDGGKLFASLFVWLKLLAKIYFCLFTTVQRIKFLLSKPNQVFAGWMGLDSLAIELICLN